VEPQSRGPWGTGVMLPALASGLALWAAFAPLNWSLLAWLAPIGWLLVIERERPVGKAGYFVLWLSGCLFWLLILQGIRLAFWPLYFGWIGLSLYLAVYIPVFVGTTRRLRHQGSVPLVIAAPLVWVGLELVRSYLLTGFAANTLAHSQAHRPLVIQLADQLGTGGIGFVMLSVSSAVLLLARAACKQVAWRVAWRGVAGSVALAGSLWIVLVVYGVWKLYEADRLAAVQEPLLRALLIQENTPTIFEYAPERNQLAWTRYLNLTRAAVQEHGPVDLVVWPESTFTGNEPLFATRLSDGIAAELRAEGVTEEDLLAAVENYKRRFDFRVARLLHAASGKAAGDPSPPETGSLPHLLVGCDFAVYTSQELERYNSALWIGPDGVLRGQYAKMHLVMFGEYIPLGPALKWLGDSFGMSGLHAGQNVESFELQRSSSSKAVRVSPNICFEITVPQLITWQVRTLANRGEAPDVLINLTNDSWFRGSSILDHHLASTILCAVETRRPVLMAANTGLSVHVDGAGRVQQFVERFEASAILAEVTADGRGGLVQWLGYPLAWLCGAICGLTWVWQLAAWLRPSRSVGKGIGSKVSKKSDSAGVAVETFELGGMRG